MATGVVCWSKTAASNSTADSAVNLAEGQSPSSLNDSGRAVMASVAKYRDDIAGALLTGGTSTAYTLTSNQVFASVSAMAGAELTITLNATSGATPTLAVDGLTAAPLRVATGVVPATGAFLAGTPYRFTYSNANTEFLLQGLPALLPASYIATSNIAAAAVTYAKVQNVTDQRLLGNISGGAAAPAEIIIGAGLTATSTTLKSAFPPPAAFKNLSIKVATNTTVTVAADFVTTTDGTTYQTTAVSSTVNLGTTGTDALDTGTIATSTWYAIWVVAKSDGTTKCIASTSAAAPTMPADYTFKARVGWVRTIAASATMYGTWQFGRRSQYIVGLTQTSTLPLVDSQAVGTYSDTTPTWHTASVSAFVPTTAGAIHVVLTDNYTGGALANCIAAPNSSYTGIQGSAPPPLMLQGASSSVAGSIEGWWLLESSNVYFASNYNGGALLCMGWEDNI